jgi:hypothetical protein
MDWERAEILIDDSGNLLAYKAGDPSPTYPVGGSTQLAGFFVNLTDNVPSWDGGTHIPYDNVLFDTHDYWDAGTLTAVIPEGLAGV